MLQTPISQSIFAIQAGVTSFFRNFLESKGFVEIHSPKLQAAATESGASVFEVTYFKGMPIAASQLSERAALTIISGKAYLAQSPQLAKQMAIAADFDRVFEVGPVFRAENSFTNRHLTEFTGLDLEMAIDESYEEVVEILDGMLMSIFSGLQSKYSREIDIIRKQFPSEPFVWLDKTLRLKWGDAIGLLRENKVEIGDFEDLS